MLNGVQTVLTSKSMLGEYSRSLRQGKVPTDSQKKNKNRRDSKTKRRIRSWSWSEFGQLNDKRYVLPDGISSLLYGHKDLEYIENFKCETLGNLTAQKITQHHENNFLSFEQGILARNERMRVINSVLLQQPLFYKTGTLKRSQFQIESYTRDFLVYGEVSAISSTSMVDPQTKTYDGKISGNILVLGSTAGRKTSFVQELAYNSMFGKLEGIHWISQIGLSKQREVKKTRASNQK